MFGGIPFEHFAQGGGGMPGGGRRSAGPVDTTKLYETLEIEKGCDAKDIKKAYRKLSRTHHPDKGGDEHKFKEINAAYEILSDPEKRAAYDKYGLEVRKRFNLLFCKRKVTKTKFKFDFFNTRVSVRMVADLAVWEAKTYSACSSEEAVVVVLVVLARDQV